MSGIETWLQVRDLIRRWKSEPDEIEHFIKNLHLPIYDKPYVEALSAHIIRRGHLSGRHDGWTTQYLWEYGEDYYQVRFKLSEVEEFEGTHPELSQRTQHLDRASASPEPAPEHRSALSRDIESKDTTSAQSTKTLYFYQGGNAWQIGTSDDGDALRTPLKGMHQIHYLLSNPNKKVPAEALFHLPEKQRMVKEFQPGKNVSKTLHRALQLVRSEAPSLREYLNTETIEIGATCRYNAPAGVTWVLQPPK